MAVSGNASSVTCEPRPEAVWPIHSFKKSGWRHRPVRATRTRRPIGPIVAQRKPRHREEPPSDTPSWLCRRAAILEQLQLDLAQRSDACEQARSWQDASQRERS
jgi:hypothetical protein